MSPNRGAAIQAIVSQEERKRPINDIQNENLQRDFEVMIMDELLRCVREVSRWELHNEPIHISDVYQITSDMINPGNYLPGRWSQGILK